MCGLPRCTAASKTSTSSASSFATSEFSPGHPRQRGRLSPLWWIAPRGPASYSACTGAQRRGSRRAGRTQRGLTLIECTMTAAIAVIVLGSALPSFQQMTARRQVEGPAVELATNLMFARSEAVSRNESVRVSFQTIDAGTCYVVHTGSADDCECSGSGPAQCANGAREIKTVLLPAGRAVTLQSNVSSMLFHPVRGTA